MSLNRFAVMPVLMQHVEDAVHLRRVRSILVRAPHVRSLHLARLDERIAAHLDGIAIAEDDGARMANRALERLGTGELFVAGVCALEANDPVRFDDLVSIAEAAPQSRSGLLSALGWVSASDLRGVVPALVNSSSAFRREIGMTTCAMRGVDAGRALDAAIREDDPELRAISARIAGRSGRIDLMPACVAASADPDRHCAVEGARAAVLLGNRADALAVLEATRLDDPFLQPALQLALKVATAKQARKLLSALAGSGAHVRTLIRSIAAAGDPHYVPWLIDQMRDLTLARICAEAFSTLTGIDLVALDLEVKPPENLEAGLGEDPTIDDVAMDEDDSLPWPDQEKIAAWWQSNAAKFSVGTRYFMGLPPTPVSCFDVLKTGFQRQRIAAAEYLTLMAPGTPLFNTSAPAWRQQRLLSKLDV